MNTKITKEKFNDETVFVLWETSRDGVNEPWVAIEESVRKVDLIMYERWLHGKSR